MPLARRSSRWLLAAAVPVLWAVALRAWPVARGGAEEAGAELAVCDDGAASVGAPAPMAARLVVLARYSLPADSPDAAASAHGASPAVATPRLAVVAPRPAAPVAPARTPAPVARGALRLHDATAPPARG